MNGNLRAVRRPGGATPRHWQKGKNASRAFLVLVVCTTFSISAIFLGAAAPGSLPVLTNIASIKQLKGTEATRGYPVRLTGVVTFQNAVRDAVIHDSSDGIFVARTNARFDLIQGQRVEVNGVTGFAGYAPRIEAHEIRVLGEGQLPIPRRLSFDWLSSGREDCQWVEIRGIVRSVTGNVSNDHHLDIFMEGNRLKVCLLHCAIPNCSKLIDSTIRVRGVLGSNRNSRRQIVAPLVWAMGTNVCVEDISDEDPFSAQVRPVSSLLRFTPEHAPNHRVKVRGTVTHQNRGTSVFIRDGTQGLWLQSRSTSALRPGHIIEAVGFEGMGKYSPLLQDVIYRRVGEEAAPAPAPITGEDALKGDHDADLVTMEGNLLDSYQAGNDRVFVLQSDRGVFNAYLPRANESTLLAIPRNGGRLRLTGICLIEEVLENVDKVRPALFRILLRSPDDIITVQKPPWWTLARLLWVLTAFGMVSLATSFWVISLQRRVQLQTAIIGKKIQREAVLEERHRVAREIHDTLAQSYSGLGFQIESIASQIPRNSSIRERIELARQMVRHGQEEFRRSLANLRAQEFEHGGLAEALGESGRQMTAGSAVAFKLSVTGRSRRLEEAIENNLLRIGQECITNAMRHAKPRRIHAELKFSPAQLQLVVFDNGSGFNVRKLDCPGNGHFGWRGIRERAEQIHAKVNLTSQPGHGTTVVVTVPIPT